MPVGIEEGHLKDIKEKARHKIVFFLLWCLAITFGFLFLSIPFGKYNETKDLATIVYYMLSPLLGLSVGFYFGKK